MKSLDEKKIIKRGLTSPVIVLASFVTVIMIGAVVLMLPISTVDGHGADVLTALFTSTSATCVTGLIVVDTGTYFSHFGQAVILLLIQIGGLGIMTFSIALTLLIGRKMTMREKVVFGDVLNFSHYDFIGTLIKSIVLITLSIEITGAWILFFAFSRTMPLAKAAYMALFHSVSAFCNAGFSLFSGSFIPYSTDIIITSTVMALIVLGGLGFTVLLDLGQFFNLARPRKFSFHTRLVLRTTGALLLAGVVLIFLFELRNPSHNLSFPQRVWGAVFQSVTARTAGFNTLPIGTMNIATLFVLLNLMFIGASPGSTGGGIKTSTFAINIQFLKSILADKERVEIYRRTVPSRTVHRAVAIVTISLGLIILCVFALLITEQNLPLEARPKGLLISLLFEATSAFGTVGLSMGITPFLSSMGKLVIVLLMLAGRVGPLTLALAIGSREVRTLYRYPETQIIVG